MAKMVTVEVEGKWVKWDWETIGPRLLAGIFLRLPEGPPWVEDGLEELKKQAQALLDRTE